MKSIFLIVAVICNSVSLYAQLNISGKITGPENQLLSSATVQLTKGLSRFTTTTDTSGKFLFTSIEPGRYSITVSHVGCAEFTQPLKVFAGMPAVRIQLKPEKTELQTVEVLGRNAKNYTSDYSFGATKIAVPVKDIPQSISTVTKELIADRQAFHLADALASTSGVVPASYYNQYTIRGISQNEEGQIINGMRTHQYYFLQPLTTNIERVEVIKGPASATFSSVDPGGSINLVTKKPLATKRKEVSMSAGSFNTIRGTLDFTGSLNKEKTLLYRLNGAYQEAGSFRDLISNKALLLSPSFTWIPNEKTAINTEIILSNLSGNLDRGQPIFGATAGVTPLNSTPISVNLGAPGDYFKSKDFIIMGNFTHRFSGNISFNASYMKQTWSEDLQEHRTTNAFAVNMNNQPVNSLAAMQFVQRRQYWNVDNLSTYVNIDVQTGDAKHRLVIGYDKNNWQKIRGGGQNAARGYLLKDGSVAASFSPSQAANYQTVNYGGVTIPRPNVPHFDLGNPNYVVPNVNVYTLNVRTALPAAQTSTDAFYLQEYLSWKNFSLLASLRQEWFEDITGYKSTSPLTVKKSALLPRVGLTYALLPQLNIYTTYLKGYQPQSNTVTLMPNTATLKAGSTFAPLKSDLKEAGIKASLLRSRVMLTAAVYHIRQQNLLLNANIPAFPDSLVTRGAERSRGFEFELAGFLTQYWQMNLAYSYIDAIIVEDNDPSLKGARKQNTPRNSGSIWSRYNFTSLPALRDLGVGLGVQYSGDKVPWFSRAFQVPAYTILDAALYYQPAKSSVQLAMNVNNLANTRYWIGAQNYLRLFPGAPRNLILTATYKF